MTLRTTMTGTGLTEACPTAQLVRATIGDLERLSAGLSLLARAAKRIGDTALEKFAREAEEAFMAQLEQLHALVPMDAWTGP